MKQFNKYNLGWFLLIAVSGVALYFWYLFRSDFDFPTNYTHDNFN